MKRCARLVAPERRRGARASRVARVARVAHVAARGTLVVVGAAVLTATIGACTIAPQPKTGPYHPSDAPLSVTRIVHGAYLLDFAGTRLLVDPWYYPRGVVGQREPLGLTFRTLPAIHAILITHAHGDHLDRRALAALAARRIPVIVAPGLAATVAATGYADVTELAVWQARSVAGVEIQAVPADHPIDEVGFVCRGNGVTVYAAGDTRYFDGLAEIAERFPTIDVALLPIGGLRLAGFLTEMDAENAARATTLLAPRRVIPTHYGITAPLPVYWLPRNPVERFQRALADARVSPNPLVVLSPGESWHYYPE